MKKNMKTTLSAIAAFALISIPAIALSGCNSGSTPSSNAANANVSNSSSSSNSNGEKISLTNSNASPNADDPSKKAEIHHVASYDEPLGENAIWCAPMELCWNEAMEVNGGPLGNADNDTKRSLNAQPFVKEYVGDDHYYNYVDVVVTPQQTADEINSALKQKFNQESELLDGTQGNPGSLFFYSMLYRKFSYAEPFQKLGEGVFGDAASNLEQDIEYFGCDADEGSYSMRQQATVLYYDNAESHALMLGTKEGDKVIFVKKPESGSSQSVFESAMKKAEGYTGDRQMDMEESFKTPNIDIDITDDFSPQLRGASLTYKGEEQVVDEAKQKTKLKMDNEGGEVKSEAYMAMKATAVAEPRELRHFLYDDEYAVFILDGNAQVNADALSTGRYSQMKPYLAARITSAASFQD